MNERTKELMEQAGIDTEVWHKDAGGDGYKTPNYQAEKLVELVVRDCVAQCALMGISNWANDDISWAVEGCIDNIKARFGVE